MSKCAACGRTILFGGVKDGANRFCNATCQRNAALHQAAAQVPAEQISQQVRTIHSGRCPKCHGPGPVDVHESYRVWSAVLVTQYRTNQTIACRRCGTRARLGDLAISTVAGWWGFPFGLIMTPVQIVRNLVSMAKTPDPRQPSPRLEEVVQLQLAAEAIGHRQQPRARRPVGV